MTDKYPELSSLVLSLQEARREHASAKQHLEAERAVWTELHQREIEAAKQAADEVTLLEGRIRELATRIHAATQETQPALGVKLRKKRQAVYDAASALEWAIQHGHHNLLQLDDKAMRQVVLGPLCPAFASVHESYEATIATDLSRALAGEESDS